MPGYCQDFGDPVTGYRAPGLWGFGADDGVHDIRLTRYIKLCPRILVPYVFVAGLNKHDYLVPRSLRRKLLSVTDDPTG